MPTPEVDRLLALCKLEDGEVRRRTWGHGAPYWLYRRPGTPSRGAYSETMTGHALPPVMDEYSRECLAIDVGRGITSDDVLERLIELFVRRGVSAYLRSDNGPEFTAKVVREWLEHVGVKTLYIEPGSLWENGYIESFNGKLRDELLNLEVFDTALEAKVLVERWRQHYNAVRPHSSLRYRPPAPEAVLPSPSGSASLRLQAMVTPT